MATYTDFIIHEVPKVIIIWSGLYALGNLVFYKNVKVNYTRKIGHFGVFFIPMFFEAYFPYKRTGMTSLLMLFSVFITYGILLTRNKIPVVQRAFLAIDRPEDRPHTLLWFYTQLLACTVVLIPIAIAAAFMGVSWAKLNLLVISLATIGDGLAEPIGVRFGKHKYKTRALFTKKNYYRTLEGSATVLIASLVVLIVFRDLFTTSQYIVALAAVPITMAIVEAVSPHTWDQPFLLAAGGTEVLLIKHLM